MDTVTAVQGQIGEMPNEINRAIEVKEVPVGTKLDISVPSILLFQGRVIIVGKKHLKAKDKVSKKATS